MLNLETTYLVLLCSVLLCLPNQLLGQEDSGWPNGAKAAVSLTFDDARFSHPEVGLELFKELDVDVTFYVVPSAVQLRHEGWKEIVAEGHEIGNHTMLHPCTGNFPWSRNKALEDYSLSTMRAELLECNQQIQALLGVVPESFAYTCGNTFVGRGVEQSSYVPLVAELFSSGRGWLNEPFNDPSFVDLALLQGNEMDGKGFAEILPMLESAKAQGAWLVLAGHEIGEGGNQTTRTTMLRELVSYLKAHEDEFWLGTVAEVAHHVQQERVQTADKLAQSLQLAATFDQGLAADVSDGDGRLMASPSYDRAATVQTANLLPEEVAWSSHGRHGRALNFKRKGRPVIYYQAAEHMTYAESAWSGSVSVWLSLDPENDLAPGYTDPIQITDSGYDDAALWVDFTKENPRSFRFGAFGDREVWNPQALSPDTNQVFLDRLIVAEDRPFARGRWTHICFTFDQLNTGSGQVALYVDGKKQGVRLVSEPFTWDQQGRIYLGLNYIGYLDELAVFDQVLDEEEVSALYSLPGGLPAILAAHD